MTVRVRDIVYSMTARTTSCFGGRFTLTGEILGRRSMRASDPPPVTIEARRGSTDAHMHGEAHRRTHTRSPHGGGRRHTFVQERVRTRTYTYVCMCDKGNLSPLPPLVSLFVHPSPPPLAVFLSPSLFLSSLCLLILQDVRHCVSRTETVAGRARSAESRHEIYGALRDVAMGLKIYSRLHVLVNPITNMADPPDCRSSPRLLLVNVRKVPGT